MEFKLNEYHRNIPDEELLADIKRVAKSLNKNSLSKRDYAKEGKYSTTTIHKRFGGWIKTLELCGMQANANQLAALLSSHEHRTIATDELLNDIKRVAKLLNKDSISSGEYNTYGYFSSDTCFKRFSTWNEALRQAGLEPYVQVSVHRIDDEVLLKEIERIWIKLGRQPTTTDMKSGIANYSLHAYAEHFGGWRGALQAFIQYIENTNANDDVLVDNAPFDDLNNIDKDIVFHKTTEDFRHMTSRDVNYRLRFKVMQRDNFKCCICGNSPAKNPDIELHVDHIIPWSKGGETVLENLQTLCSVCNLGKSDLEM
ncbi:MAG: HNH endonuclease [Eubacterium sp.]|nr:HNH endonuclease [Eubacterium sp.]